MNIGKRIHDLRLKRHISAKYLAQEADVSPAFISALERQASSCSIKTLDRICEVLEVSLAEFFNEEKSLSDQKIAFYVEKLGESEKQALSQFLATLVVDKK